MRCISPISIPDPSGKQKTLTVPCSKCQFCLQNHRQDWSFRIHEELKVSESATFLTMTYDDNNIPLHIEEENLTYTSTLKKRDVQLFLKRLRKENNIEYQKIKKGAHAPSKTPTIKYYLVGEYGETTLRPHYHAIMFNIQPNTTKNIMAIWKLGNIHQAPVNGATINYCTKYLINRHKHDSPALKPFSQMSQGLGKSYIKNKKYHVENQKLTVKNQSGTQQRLPRYYKEKFFTKPHLSRLAKEYIQQMDKREEAERERIVKLGNYPPKYLQDQIETAMNNIKSKSEKNQKL